MADPIVFPNDLVVNGTLAPSAFAAPSNSIGDAAIRTAAAGQEIGTGKVRHRHHAHYAQESATTAVTERRVLAVIRGTVGTATHFRAGAVVPNIGAATVTVDLLRGGVSVLSAPIVLSSAHAAYQVIAGTITSPAIAVNNVLEVALVATAGGGTLARGVLCEVIYDEDAS